MMDLLSIFQSLALPLASGDTLLRFETVAIAEYQSYLLGKTVEGDPALLIDVAEVDTAALAPMRLQSLTVYQRARCKISIAGLEQERTFTVLWHTNGSSESRALYLGILSPLMSRLGEKPTAAKIATVIEALVQLFRSLAQPSRKTTQGLWAELLVLSKSCDAVTLTGTWHAHADDRYDFNAGSQRVEVKSAGGGVRRHHFSFEQLHPPAGAQVVIASLFTTRATGGASLQVLMDRVLARLSERPDLQTRIYEVVAETLGIDFEIGMSESYDEQLGVSSLLFFDHTAIPSIATPLPMFVSDVHFVADLSEAISLPANSLASRGGLYAAL